MRSFTAFVGMISTAVLAASSPLQAAEPSPATPDRSGVVLVEQGGRVVALGTVLNGDGRVVTASSRLGEQLPVLLRYANGKLEVARVGHSDRTRDLALLVPKTARWRDGFKAARGPHPGPGSALRGFNVGANRTLLPGPRTVKPGAGRALTLDSAAKPEELGGPLLDERGEAVAVLVSGCAGSSTPAPCAAPPVALPVTEVRAFLRTLPPEAELNVPWLGLVGVSADTGVVRGLRVTQIDPGSPAANVGLRAGADFASSDLLVAVGGQPVQTPEALRAQLTRYAAGERVELLVFGKAGYRSAMVRLADRPAGPKTAPPAAHSSSSSAEPAAGSKPK